MTVAVLVLLGLSTPSSVCSPQLLVDDRYARGMVSLSKLLHKTLDKASRDSLVNYARGGDKVLRLHALWRLGKGDKEKATAFLDALERALGAKVPGWWRDSVYEASTAKADLAARVRSRPRKNVTVSAKGVVVDISPVSWAAPYPIRVFDQTTMKALWIGQVWATGVFGISGMHSHRFELIVDGDVIIVYGTGDSEFYVEAFSVKTGSAHLRFCSYY